jgi:lipopolysaccharide transport system permease protein
VTEGGGAVEKFMKSAEITVIKPNGKYFNNSFREILLYRDLLYFLTWKNFIVKYKQTLIGVSWAILQPLAQMVVFSILFGKFARIPSDNVPYPIFVYSALLPWTFFSNSIIACNNSIINHAALINKVYFPRLLIPLSAVGSQLIDLGIAFLVLFGIMAYYHFTIQMTFLMILPLILLTIFAAISFGIFVAALAAMYRDFRHIIPFLVTLMFFITPVIYPPSIINSHYEFLIHLNPMSGIITGFRSAILGHTFDWPPLLLSFGILTIVFLFGIIYFNRAERQFADVV